MHVGTPLERVDQTGVVRQVRQDPQLDLRVVGRHQSRALVGDERASHLATGGGSHGHVLQVGCLARDASGGGVGLLQRGVDATVGTDQWRQRVGIGAAQLLDVAIAQQRVEDRMVVDQGHLLQRVGVG